MQEKENKFNNINKVSLTGISRLFFVWGISLLFIQFLWIPALAQNAEYQDGYNLIYYDNGSKEVINGALNFLRYDGAWRPNEELNISNGSWPYLYSQNTTSANFKVDDTTLSIPKANTVFKTNLNSISYELKYTKSELQGKGISINKNSEFIDIPFHLKSRKPKKEFKDRNNIKYGRFHFKAGMEHIVVHDDTPRDYIEDGKVFQDVTYLFQPDYEFKIENGTIQLVFNNNSLDKLTGNVIVEIRTWDIIGANNWGGNVTFSQTTDVKATGNAELKQTVADYSLYTRFDEGKGKTIHNENPLNVRLGDLLGAVGTGTYTAGKYGQAIYFNGIDNKILFKDDPAFRLAGDFTISYYIKLTSDVSNVDSDITRKGSTATANPDSWWKMELTNNLMHGSVTKNGATAVESYDTVDRRDGNWHFVAYTRGGTTCSLIVDGTTVKTTSNCPTNAVNTALLSIGAKDTYVQTTGLDFTRGSIDEVRIFNRKLSASELTAIQNNAHNTAGTITRNLVSLIKTGEEIKELGCYGTWDSSITKVDVMASADNSNWNMIKSIAAPNVNYPVNAGNNYKYSRCSLSTTDSSNTPIIQSIRANIGPKGANPIIAEAGGPYSGTPGVLINFIGSASGGSAPYLYKWNFGDGGTSSLANPAHAYTTPGPYTATLTVKDNAGITSSPDTAPVSVASLNVAGSISGYKINDINGNGKWNAGESGISGWKIKLVGKNIKKEILTDALGFYIFDNLPAGKYTVSEENKKGWKHTSSTSRKIKLKNGMKSINNIFTNKMKKR
ncbi:MAG TPA: PKD domain-containing protein [Candidatus Methanoperedens sp.]|nr:PKD domain-containing protein [Candidatus Methanoperedens sp.]